MEAAGTVIGYSGTFWYYCHVLGVARDVYTGSGLDDWVY
jgi:hypothetical protein